MSITKNLHKNDNISERVLETTLSESWTQFLENVTLLQREKDNKQFLEILFNNQKQRYRINLDPEGN